MTAPSAASSIAIKFNLETPMDATKSQWAEALLLDSGALERCAMHEGSITDAYNPEAVEVAASRARRAPFASMTPDAAAQLIRDAMKGYGDDCPLCGDIEDE
jgi:hypothetical protein